MKQKIIPRVCAFFLFASVCSYAQVPAKGVKEFVTATYVHGMPYSQAKAFGPQVLPELANMLKESHYEEFRPNIVSMIGRISDPKGIPILKNYLYTLKGELNYPTFISMLAVFQSLGYIAQNGNQEVLKMLYDWSNPAFYSTTGLSFTYQNYKGSLMGATISSLAIQGLGISGTPSALKFLKKMDQPESVQHKQKLANSISGAIILNNRVKKEGAAKVFEKEEIQ